MSGIPPWLLFNRLPYIQSDTPLFSHPVAIKLTIFLYDPTFGPKALNRHIYESDFKKYSDIDLERTRDTQLEIASSLANDGFSDLKIQGNNLAGQTIYQLVDLPSELVLRKAVQNISKVSRTKQANRIEICKCLKLLCEEGVPFTLARFDIRKFYESINRYHIQDLIDRRLSTLPSTRLVLSTFMKQCEIHSISTGLPRGLAISAALSEFYLNDFDVTVQRKLKPHFYARYVDDIVVLLSPECEITSLYKKVSSMLPSGLELNKSKSKILSFTGLQIRDHLTEHKFDYLGYSFSVSHIIKSTNSPWHRCLTLDISQSKIKKIKTRVVRALIQYLHDGKFVDLHDRFKILTCNYEFYDHRKQRKRLAGNRHSYGLIDFPSESLDKLDRFIKHILLSNNGKISALLAHSLSNAEKEILLSLSFKKGFEKRTYFYFSPTKLKKLVECWKYA